MNSNYGLIILAVAVMFHACMGNIGDSHHDTGYDIASAIRGLSLECTCKH